MLQPRIIPVLLLKDNRLLKSFNYKNFIYIGDPVNTVRIFSEFQVDELCIFDINASTSDHDAINYDLLSLIASYSTMPLCYGGGVFEISQFEKLISLGFEKVSINHNCLSNPSIISDFVGSSGSQSVVVSIDIFRCPNTGDYFIYDHVKSQTTDLSITSYIDLVQNSGCGEIIFNFVNNDGTNLGYDLDFLSIYFDVISVPITINCGCANNHSRVKALERFGLIGLAGSSDFVLSGPNNAVLIQYPNAFEKQQLNKIVG